MTFASKSTPDLPKRKIIKIKKNIDKIYKEKDNFQKFPDINHNLVPASDKKTQIEELLLKVIQRQRAKVSRNVNIKQPPWQF